MNIPLILCQTQLKVAWNTMRYDKRMQVAMIFAVLFSIGMGYWSINTLLSTVPVWQNTGELGPALWQLCLIAWGGMSFFTLISVLPELQKDETHLLFTMPVRPATLFRAFYSLFLLNGLWSWLILQAVIMGYALTITLGWEALSWLLVLQLGIVVSVYCTILAALFYVCYLLPRGRISGTLPQLVRDQIIRRATIDRARSRAGKALYTPPGLFAHPSTAPPHNPGSINPRPTNLLNRRIRERIGVAVVLLLLFTFVFLFIGQFVEMIRNAGFWLSPELGALLLLLIVILILGPLAAPNGKLYAAAYGTLQGRDRARRTLMLPGISTMQHILERRRTLTGALFARALMSQSRNIFFWIRALFIAILLVVYPILYAPLSGWGIPDVLFVTGCPVLLASLALLETTPNAISGEGNRLTLYLTTSLSVGQILRAKLLLFLLPALFLLFPVPLLLSWWLALDLDVIIGAFVASLLILVGMISFSVLASAWDLDLNTTVEGKEQMLLQEEGPFSPRRMGIFNLCLLLLVAMLAVLWLLPIWLALPVLAVIDVAVIFGMWRFSLRCVARLLRVG